MEGRGKNLMQLTDTFDFKMGRQQVIPGFEKVGFCSCCCSPAAALSATLVLSSSQAILGMHVGARRRFILPPEIGYTQGVGDNKPGPMPPGLKRSQPCLGSSCLCRWGERRALESHRREPLVFEVQVWEERRRRSLKGVCRL